MGGVFGSRSALRQLVPICPQATLHSRVANVILLTGADWGAGGRVPVPRRLDRGVVGRDAGCQHGFWVVVALLEADAAVVLTKEAQLALDVAPPLGRPETALAVLERSADVRIVVLGLDAPRAVLPRQLEEGEGGTERGRSERQRKEETHAGKKSWSENSAMGHGRVGVVGSQGEVVVPRQSARRCEMMYGEPNTSTTSLGIYQHAVGAVMSAGAETPKRDGRCPHIVPRAWVRCQADLLGSVCGLLAHIITDRKANHGDTRDRRRNHTVCFADLQIRSMHAYTISGYLAMCAARVPVSFQEPHGAFQP